MIDINRLKGEMKASGLTHAEIAKKMNISARNLRNLLNEEAKFKVEHVDKLTSILGLSKDMRDKIFFAKEVHKLSTTA